MKLIVYVSYTGNTKMIANRIKPYATNAGWLGRTFTEIKKLCPNSKVEEGMNIVNDAGDYRIRELITSLDEIDNWINSL